MTYIYRLSIAVYSLGIALASLFHKKARLFRQGRKGIFDQILAADIASQAPIWFHCSSLGEFEQARSIIDTLHNNGEKILLTFFSPSGYEIRKNYAFADWVFYLPTDTPKNATLFLEYTQPKVAIFVKYDLWYYYLTTLKTRDIPTFLVSALFQSNQIFFKPMAGKLHRKMLNSFSKIYLQNEESKDLLEEIKIRNVEVVGDTRVDSVLERACQTKDLPILANYLENQKAIVVGSAYGAEVDIIVDSLPFLKGEKIIIAPHEVDESNVLSIQDKFEKNVCVRYSEYTHNNSEANVLIIDNIGTLFHTYRHAKLVFIGGAFAKGLHNTLEPAAFGVPICFGPHYHRFIEAVEMVNQKCAFPIHSASDLKSLYSRLQDDSFTKTVTIKINEYMQDSKGASYRILNDVLHQIHKG